MYVYEVKVKWGPNGNTIHVKKFQLLIRYGIETKARERETEKQNITETKPSLQLYILHLLSLSTITTLAPKRM